MKLLTPSIKDCRYIHQKLRLFYKQNKDIDKDTYPDLKEFDRALKRFCDFYNLNFPKIEWHYHLEHKNAVGLCDANGKISLIAPQNWKSNEYYWIRTTYHELGHYVLWSEAEKKAKLFANRMMGKWRK